MVSSVSGLLKYVTGGSRPLDRFSDLHVYWCSLSSLYVWYPHRPPLLTRPKFLYSRALGDHSQGNMVTAWNLFARVHTRPLDYPDNSSENSSEGVEFGLLRRVLTPPEE